MICCHHKKLEECFKLIVLRLLWNWYISSFIVYWKVVRNVFSGFSLKKSKKSGREEIRKIFFQGYWRNSVRKCIFSLGWLRQAFLPIDVLDLLFVWVVGWFVFGFLPFFKKSYFFLPMRHKSCVSTDAGDSSN